MTKPKIKLGRNMTHALAFATEFPGWQTYTNRCTSTVQAIRKLEKRGLVQTNEFCQFKLTTHTK